MDYETFKHDKGNELFSDWLSDASNQELAEALALKLEHAPLHIRKYFMDCEEFKMYLDEAYDNYNESMRYKYQD